MKMDTADSKGKWLVRVPILPEAVDSRSRPEGATCLSQSPRGVRGESARGRKSVAKVAKSCEVNSTVGRPKNPGETGVLGVFRSSEAGGQGQNRTADLRFFRPSLYQLSYLAPIANLRCKRRTLTTQSWRG